MQKFVLIVLRSRTQAFNLNNKLLKSNIPCEIITTPKEIFIGCGFSVKIDEKYFVQAKNICNNLYIQSLAGFYLMAFDGRKNVILSLL